MTLQETLRELKSLGTEPNRKIYARHGVTNEMFGVSYANLDKVKKKIKMDHGETSCQIPDADAYILKAAQRKRR